MSDNNLSTAVNTILSALNRLGAWIQAIAGIAFALYLLLLVLQLLNLNPIARVQTGPMQDMGILIAGLAFALRGLR